MSSILALSLGLPVGAGLSYLVEQRRCPWVCYSAGSMVQRSLGRCTRARDCSSLVSCCNDDNDDDNNSNNNGNNTDGYEDQEEDGVVLLVRRSLSWSSSSHSVGEFLWKRIRGYAIVTWCGFAVFIYILWTHQLDGMTHHHHHHNHGNNGSSSSYAFDDDSLDDNYDIPTDPSETTNHHSNHNSGDTMSLIILLRGLALGGLSGILLGCGLMGSMLNYQQIRVGDTHFPNSDLTVQLLVSTRSGTDSTTGSTNAGLTTSLDVLGTTRTTNTNQH